VVATENAFPLSDNVMSHAMAAVVRPKRAVTTFDWPSACHTESAWCSRERLVMSLRYSLFKLFNFALSGRSRASSVVGCAV
jgi:hypothetical protein